MAYKDKDRQREVNRQASQRRRDKLKGMTPDPKKGATISLTRHTPLVIPEQGITEEQFIKKVSEIYDVPQGITQAEIDALPDDVKVAIAREPKEEHKIRTERAVRYNRLFGEHIELGTDLELCKYCRKPLPKLERPRRHTGACLPCVMAKPQPTQAPN